MNNIYGYIRVSTISQREDRQWAALEEFDIPRENVFVDKQSGKDFDRPAYNELMARLSESDTLVVKSLDRLGRSYDEMIQQLDIITREKGAAIVVIDLPLLDTRNRYGNDLTAKLISNLVIQVFSYVAETERTMNHQRKFIFLQEKGNTCRNGAYIRVESRANQGFRGRKLYDGIIYATQINKEE